LPPENEAPACGRDRHYRLEIAYDAFCEHCPPPRTLFRADPARRDLTSWCERMTRWTQRRRPRCHHCERARSLYLAARDTGDWKAEVALYKLARRGAVRLLAERRQYPSSDGSSGPATANTSPATARNPCRRSSSPSYGR
ncbi:MAG TPA: hypothetical protein VJY39_15640, partial [Acidisphaera sp.]|nr:hypothetical protein [Acidisphaera sp.]